MNQSAIVDKRLDEVVEVMMVGKATVVGKDMMVGKGTVAGKEMMVGKATVVAKRTIVVKATVVMGQEMVQVSDEICKYVDHVDLYLLLLNQNDIYILDMVLSNRVLLNLGMFLHCKTKHNCHLKLTSASMDNYHHNS